MFVPSWRFWRFVQPLRISECSIFYENRFQSGRSEVMCFSASLGPGLQLFTNHFHQSQPYVSWKSYPYQRLSLVIIAPILETWSPEENLKFMFGRWVGFSSWWFQPLWKICSSNWIISSSGENKKKWNHQLGFVCFLSETRRRGKKHFAKMQYRGRWLVVHPPGVNTGTYFMQPRFEKSFLHCIWLIWNISKTTSFSEYSCHIYKIKDLQIYGVKIFL